MNHSFKKQLGVAIAVLCLMMIFSIEAPSSARAQYTDPSSGESVSYPTQTYGLPPADSGNSNLTQIKDVNGLTSRIASIGTVVLYLLVAAAVIFIVWNVVRYFIGGKEGESRGPAGLNILWGLIGLFVIISLWGLVNILLNTFGTNTTINVKSKLPQADFVNN